MRTTMIGIGALAIGLLAGCASDVGEHGSTLRRVNEREMTSQVLYLVQGLAVPLTAEEMQEQGEDVALATPVRVEIFDNVAVAWYAPEGEALIGRDNIRALWTVVDRQYISNELAPEPSVPVEPSTEPGTTYRTPNVETSIPGVDADLGITYVDVSLYANPVGVAIIDFVDEMGGAEEAWMMEEVAAGHPGCI